MPIYAYKCNSCGFAKDVLQKISDQPLVQCPSCEAQAFTKQVTAAGFQLKGSGWYVTDFKGGGKGASTPAGDESKSATATATATASTGAADSAAPAKKESAGSSSPAPAKKADATPSSGSGSGSGS